MNRKARKKKVVELTGVLDRLMGRPLTTAVGPPWEVGDLAHVRRYDYLMQ